MKMQMTVLHYQSLIVYFILSIMFDHNISLLLLKSIAVLSNLLHLLIDALIMERAFKSFEAINTVY